jgi:hypothetical protein
MKGTTKDDLKTAAVKFDTEKPRVELLPKDVLLEVATILTFGAKKYSDWNWTLGFHWSRLYGAAERHMFAFEQGENLDPESGRPHLAHALCCLMFLLSHQLHDMGTDDRHVFATKPSVEVK